MCTDLSAHLVDVLGAMSIPLKDFDRALWLVRVAGISVWKAVDSNIRRWL